MRKRHLLLGSLLALPSPAFATWSVVAVDRSTGSLVFELYALDTAIDVPAVGASPAQTRVAAMAGHVRAKGVYTGLFKRTP